MIPDRCKIEEFFGKWEYGVDLIACASDVDGLSMRALLELADGESAELWDTLELGYTETAGHSELRSEITRQYELIPAEQVTVCGGGAAEALFLLANGLLEPGDHAVVVWPAFESLHRLAPALGASLTAVALDPEGGWHLDLEAVRQALRPNTRALFVNFPHNPTGALPSVADFQALLALARDADVTVVSDEVYRYLEYDPTTTLPAACDLDERAVSVGVLSKAYGLAGLRVGWLATRNAAVTGRVRQLKDYTTVCASAPSEILSLIALRAKDHLVERSRGIILANLKLLEDFLGTHQESFRWDPPMAGPMAFPQLRLPIPVESFVTDLAREKGVLLLPGTVFDLTDNRLRFGLGRSDLPAALDRLDDFLIARR